MGVTDGMGYQEAIAVLLRKGGDVHSIVDHVVKGFQELGVRTDAGGDLTAYRAHYAGNIAQTVSDPLLVDERGQPIEFGLPDILALLQQLSMMLYVYDLHGSELGPGHVFGIWSPAEPDE